VDDHDLRRLRRGEFVKAKALLLFISFAFVPTVQCFGQVNCNSSTKLICQFPVSSGGLQAFAVGSSQFITTANGIAGTIDSSIAAQLTQLPIPSATVGVVSLRQKAGEAPVPFDNLGPILTDRPDTVGKGHVFVGFSYQHFNFNAVDGVNLNALPVSFTFSQSSPFNPGDIQTYYASETNNISFKVNQYVAVATMGVTKSTDVTIVAPFNSVSLGVVSSNYTAFFYDSATGQYVNVSPNPQPKVSTSGSANGIGDITVGIKQLLLGGDGSRTAIAAGAAMRFPSGDALNFLGSGAVGGNIYGLFEYRGRVTPHLKLSYQWNRKSQVMNLNEQPSIDLPGGLQYAAGADVKVVRPLTLAIDLLGNQFANSPSFTQSTSQVCPATSSSGACILPPTSISTGLFTTESTGNNTYTSTSVSAGLKWTPVRHVLVFANVLEQVNNVGLRSNLVPLFGIAFKR